MAQVTWRTPDELLERVRLAATSSGRSVNEWMTQVLDAATDPELSGSEAERVRDRLARAGLLAKASAGPVTRPDPLALDEARQAAGQGTSLSDLVIDARR